MPDRLTAQLARDAAPRTYAALTARASRSTVDRAVAGGKLVRLLPNQYCLAEHAESWTMRARAAARWAGPGAAVAGLAAMAVFGYTPCPISEIDLVVPWGQSQRKSPDWLKVRRLTVPARTAVWSPRTAVLLPSFALALAYASIPESQRASFVHGAVRAGLVDASSLLDALNALPRVTGRAELLRRVGHIGKGAESYLEERGMARVFRGGAFADLTYQHRLRVRGNAYRLDAVHLPTRTIFELDGGGHGEPDQRQKDVTRDGILATMGYLTTRFTFEDVTKRADWCRELAREVIELRTSS